MSDFKPIAAAQVLFVFLLSLVFTACAPPKALSDFADKADKSLEEGAGIFADLHDSCMRRHAAGQVIAPIFRGTAAADNSSANAACAPFATEADGLKKATDVLAAYFRAIQQLSSFNVSSVTGPNGQSLQNAAFAANLSLVQADSLSKLATVISEAFTVRYQQGRLERYVRDADPAIDSVTTGLSDVLSKDYEGLLQEEQRAVSARYQIAGNTQDSAVILLLNRAYEADLAELAHRRARSQAYITALHEIRDAHHEVVTSGKRLNTTQLSIALQPYTNKLQELLPVIEKGS